MGTYIVTDEQLREALEKILTSSKRPISVRPQPPTRLDWAKWGGALLAAVGVAWGVSSYLFMTRSDAAIEHSMIERGLRAHDAQEFHPSASHRVGHIENESRLQREMLERLNHNMVKIGERLRVRGMASKED